MKKSISMFSASALASSLLVMPAQAQVSDKELKSISTPDKVETSIGTLKFLDGDPAKSNW